MVGSSREVVMSWIVASALVAGLVAVPSWWHLDPDLPRAAELRGGGGFLRAVLPELGEPRLPFSYDRIDREADGGDGAAPGG